ncbi:MAG TPA: cysteine--tRNA ligase [Syntrophales bacterium]|nr:cysteine--tRNA ligase [Syntrophales bacterium]HPO35486.1 cysteine--tRNA ligase [Syntrophales bacterium]
MIWANAPASISYLFTLKPMAIVIYNTLTQKKEPFFPLKPGRVGLYACGITAYDFCHLGHARSAIVFDVIVRYLRYRGYQVTFVKNFTDVDDKIIARALREGCTIYDISNRFIDEHNRDMARLNVLSPDHTPRATDYVQDMIAFIATLISRGLAYDTPEGDVYFAVNRFTGYGKLSHRQLEEMAAGARVQPSERKRHPLDFALWKASKEGEPSWESPWGKGRPGWHTECVVMSRRLLGETFDIHGGGEDLIFPHHENEIAQAEGASGKPLARYWMHNAFIRVSGEKMSKSLGNVTTIREITEKWHPEVIRLFVLQSHYRSPIDISEASLSEARTALRRYYSTMKALQRRLAEAKRGTQTQGDRQVLASLDHLRVKFTEAMDDDFNTARALGYIFENVRLLNSYLSGKVNEEVLEKARAVFSELGNVLGVFQADPQDFLEADRERALRLHNLDRGEIERLIAERTKARKAKDWSRADEIRKYLHSLQVTLQDAPTGTEWYID